MSYWFPLCPPPTLTLKTGTQRSCIVLNLNSVRDEGQCWGWGRGVLDLFLMNLNDMSGPEPRTSLGEASGRGLSQVRGLRPRRGSDLARIPTHTRHPGSWWQSWRSKA